MNSKKKGRKGRSRKWTPRKLQRVKTYARSGQIAPPAIDKDTHTKGETS